MGYSREIYDSAEKIMRERRRTAEDDAEKRRSSFYKACPRAQQIERRLSATAISAARAVLGGKNAAEQMQKLKTENQELQAEFLRLLKVNGFENPEPHYRCSRCKDTGYIDGKMCGCMKDLLRTESYRRLNELAPLSLSTFESFSLGYYSDENREGKPSDRKIMSDAFHYCVDYANQFTLCSPNLIMTGSTGLGKTHLSLAVANEIIQKGFGVVYCSAGSLIAKLENEHFDRTADESTAESLQSCDLLILDDLGTEFKSSFTSSAVYNIVNMRLLLQKPTIISTNLSTKEMVEYYSERFASRIIGSYRRIFFVGRDIRQQKRMQRTN